MTHKVFHTFIISVTINMILASKGWIDPHDMNIKLNPVRAETLQDNNDEAHHSCYCKDMFYRDNSSHQLRKLLEMIIDVIYFDRRSEVYKGIIDINMDAKDYDFLKKYVSADLRGDNIVGRLGEILEKSLEKSIYSSTFFSIGEHLYLMVFNENTLLILALIVTAYTLWKIKPHNYKLTTLFKLFLPLVYISDFVLRYRAKLEEVEIDKYMQYESFEKCDPKALSWWGWINNIFTDYCRNNKREFLLSQRAATHIFTPLSVISEQFDIIVIILRHLGTGFGSFMQAFIGQMSWYYQLFIGIPVFLLVTIILLMLCSYIFGISPKLNLFHMIQFEFLHKEINQGLNSYQSLPNSVSREDSLQWKNQTKVVVLRPSSSNPRKINLPTFKTKSKNFNRKKITSVACNCNKISVPVSSQTSNSEIE